MRIFFLKTTPYVPYVYIVVRRWDYVLPRFVLFVCLLVFVCFFKLIKIHQHCWKENIKISKAAKFGNDILKSNQDMAPQLNGILLGQVYDPILNYLCSSQT